MDLLSDILSMMRLSGTLYFRTAFTAPWGVAVPDFENVSRFHYVHRGRCFALVEGETDPVLLEQGDLIIVTRGAAHSLSDPVDAPARAVDRVVEESGFTGTGALVYGAEAGGHETQLVCGHFSFDEGAAHGLLDALPRFIQLKDYGGDTPDWLNDTLKLIGGEAGQNRLGADLIALKLSEIIYTQAIRKFLHGAGRSLPVLAAFADPQLHRALEAFHRSPAQAWSVGELASVAGMSRTAFSNRFNALMSDTPLSYLTSWRMQMARRMLLHSEIPIIEIAERTGYSSEAAFSRVFKRHFERPPAGFRREADARKPRKRGDQAVVP